MRPSLRLLTLASVLLAVSIVFVALGNPLRGLLPFLWLGLAVLLLADLAVSLSRAVGVDAVAPRELFVGETGLVRLQLAPARPQLTCRINWPEGLDGPAEAAADEAGVIQLPVKARRRGSFALDRSWFSWPSRIGLLDVVRRADLGLTIKAVPSIRPVVSGTIDAKVRSTLFGLKEVSAIGEGSEFHQLREFTKGMDIRSIDWKQSARHRQLLAKETRAERNHHVIVALDNGYLMREEIDGVARIDHAVHAALATAWAAALGGDLVGLFVYDAVPRLFVPPEPGRKAFPRLRSHTADLAYVSRETNHTLAMASLMAKTPRRSLIIVFTDFVDPTTAELLVDNAAVLNRRHVVVMVAIADPALRRLAWQAPDSLDDVARAVVGDELIRERAVVMERLAGLGITVIDAEPRALTPRLVSTYLDIKAREVI
ncbi:MAG: DUF58 domain-containing protein [Pseudomonadota bacterium]